jgi:DegV family protein with EDD domain
MKNKVIISSDSTCDLSPELVEKYGILIDPMPIILGEKVYSDGIDITPDDLFEYSRRTGSLAKTSAHNMQHYHDLFERLTADGSEVVHFDISGSMSGSYNNARMAAQDFPGVCVIDSRNLSTGIGLLVLRAAELARDGMSGSEIADTINGMTDKVDASFVIDTLEFLHKGGRCSSVALLGSNLLKLKPCIEVVEGAMGVGKKYRGKIEDVMVEYVRARLADTSDIDLSRIFITHTCENDETVKRVRAEVEKLADFDEILETRAGCTVSVHCGPNTLGVLFIRKNPIRSER